MPHHWASVLLARVRASIATIVPQHVICTCVARHLRADRCASGGVATKLGLLVHSDAMGAAKGELVFADHTEFRPVLSPEQVGRLANSKMKSACAEHAAFSNATPLLL